MKRTTLVGRVTLLSEKREALVTAARLAQGPHSSEYNRVTTARDLELAAIAYATVAFRYIGGER